MDTKENSHSQESIMDRPTVNDYASTIADEKERDSFIMAYENECGIENNEEGYRLFVKRRRIGNIKRIIERQSVSAANMVLKEQGDETHVISLKEVDTYHDRYIEYIDSEGNIGRLETSDDINDLDDRTIIKLEGYKNNLPEYHLDDYDSMVYNPLFKKEIITSTQFLEELLDYDSDCQVVQCLYDFSSFEEYLRYIYYDYENLEHSVETMHIEKKRKFMLSDYLLFIKPFCIQAVIDNFKQSKNNS